MCGSKPSFVRSLRLFLALLTAAGLIGVSVAAGKKKKKTRALPPPPVDLPGHVYYLARQLTYLPLDESGPITSQIQKLIVDHLQEWLANRAPSGVEVRRELENVFSQLHYPLAAQPAAFAEPWKGEIVIGAGYNLRWTEYNRVTVVALFVNRGGKTRLVDVANFVPRTDLHYEILNESRLNDFRFFVYGFRPGKSQLRLTATLYSFDGQSLRSLWEKRDIYDGKMTVDQGKVFIRYLIEEEYVQETLHGRKPPRHEAIYKSTPQGLELEIDHEIPF